MLYKFFFDVAYCHRDLKNENILITSTEPHLKVKVFKWNYTVRTEISKIRFSSHQSN